MLKRKIVLKKNPPVTATTTDLGNRLNGIIVLYLNDLANPKKWS
ncbi:hypothetical protein [Flavobacterium marginilacus]|nr:hypothetical protein [Flavobacterium marginilacus]